MIITLIQLMMLNVPFLLRLIFIFESIFHVYHNPLTLLLSIRGGSFSVSFCLVSRYPIIFLPAHSGFCEQDLPCIRRRAEIWAGLFWGADSLY